MASSVTSAVPVSVQGGGRERAQPAPQVQDSTAASMESLKNH